MAAPEEGSIETRPELLRFTTAGGVDDGKSTLIGRLLYDTQSVLEDQLDQIRGLGRNGAGEADLDLALLTDGLRAERVQKITIDVAYRYFATPRRRFIIADTPGHVQYTRNMVTGASNADLAVVLVDASRGVLTQSRRHAFISSLLGIPKLLVAVNKMDLVDFDEEVFERVVEDFRAFAARLTIKDIDFVPTSALKGDNVVHASERMRWYQGGPLLHHLETASVDARSNSVDFRYPVQHVIRPNANFRGYAGTVASGGVRPGEEVQVLPAGLRTRVREVRRFDEPLEAARAGDAIVLTLEDELDVSRGDMIVRPRNVPHVSDRLEAYLCWMSEAPLDPGLVYRMRHTTREVQARVSKIEYRVDVDTLSREEAATLGLNDIGRVEIQASGPLLFDSYRVNTATGSFVLMHPHTNDTVAAGMIRGPVQRVEPRVSPDVVWEGWNVPRAEREDRTGHRALVLWFTGPSGAGKSTLARALERRLFLDGHQTMLLEGDQVRHGLSGDLGFSKEDRAENIRRVGEVARLFFEHGSVVLCAFVSPYAEDRGRIRSLLPQGGFAEVEVRATPDTLVRRDTKGLYGRALAGESIELPGFNTEYERPPDPELVVDTSAMSVDEAVTVLERFVRARVRPGAEGEGGA